MDSNSSIGLYIKAIGTLVVTGLTAYITAVQDNSVNTVEWITIIIAVLVGTGIVWAIPSTPEWFRAYAKTLAAALVAGLGSLAVGLTDGGDGTLGSLSQAEVITAVVAFLIAGGFVGSASNAASSDPVDTRTNKIVGVSREQKAHAMGIDNY